MDKRTSTANNNSVNELEEQDENKQEQQDDAEFLCEPLVRRKFMLSGIKVYFHMCICRIKYIRHYHYHNSFIYL